MYHPDVVGRGLHDVRDAADRSVAPVAHLAADQLVRRGIERPDVQVGLARQDVASGDALGVVEGRDAREPGEHAVLVHVLDAAEPVAVEHGRRERHGHARAQKEGKAP